MKKRIAALALVFLTVAVTPMFGQTDDIEAFRADMLQYVSGLGRLSPALMERYGADADSLARAEASIRNLSADELLAMKQQMDRVPFWRDIPSIVAYASARPNGVPSPRELARGLSPTMAPYSPELVRGPLLKFVASLKQIPAQQVHPDYQERLARIEKEITNATPDQLLELSRGIGENVGKWDQQLRDAMEGRANPDLLRSGPTNHCGSGFGAVLCELQHVISDIGSFFNALPTYATNAFNSIKNIFSDLFSNFPSTVSGAMNTAISLLGLNNVNWNQVAQTAETYAKLPCPPANFNLPAFGRVGDLRTWTNYNGTIGFAGNTIADVMPGDILTSLDVQALTHVLNFPVQWLGHCLEESWKKEFKGLQAAHYTHVTTNLDVQLSTRATQASVNGTQAQTNDIDADVAKVEAKLDRLGVVAGRVESTTQKIIATTDRNEVVANRLETTSIRFDTTATRLEQKVDNLQLQQGQTSDSLADLKKAYLRMLIEADLVRQSNTRISLFQLPTTVGGLLETVRDIVQETMTRRAAAGVDVRQAQKYLADASAAYASGNYKACYSSFRAAYQKAVN